MLVHVCLQLFILETVYFMRYRPNVYLINQISALHFIILSDIINLSASLLLTLSTPYTNFNQIWDV